MTRNGGAVITRTKRITVVVADSMEAERIASVKVTDIVEYLLTAEDNMGAAADEPVLVTTDNLPNQRVGSGEGSAVRSRHTLKRYLLLQQRILSGQVKVRFVDDANNPADFLTKWLDRLKLEASIEYATNSRNAVDATSAATLDRERAAFGAALTLARAAAPRPAANAASAPATATSDATLASALADSRLPSSTELQLIDALTEAYWA